MVYIKKPASIKIRIKDSKNTWLLLKKEEWLDLADRRIFMKGEILLAGLDIGTSKTNTLIAELRDDNTIDIVGVGSVPSKGIKRGIIIDLEQAVDAVRESVNNAERMAGVQLDSAVVAVNGSHITSFNSQGVIAISKEHPEITE